MARTFVAVWPSAEVRDALSALPRAHHPGVRWTHPEQWHVTLRFLGEADPDEVAAAVHGLSHPPVTARLSGSIRPLGRHVLVVPVHGLATLAAEVRARTAALGSQRPQRRPFVGHVTLARLRGAAACELTRGAVTAEWQVSEVTVVTSRLDPDRARYTIVATVPLAG